MSDVEVYLFTGPENGDKGDAVATIRAAAEKKNGGVDFYRYYASETRIADVVSQLQNASLFTSSLFIILKNAELIKLKTDIDLLVQYIKNAGNSPNVLILESDENGIEKRIESAVPSSHKKIFWEMFDNQKPQWVRNYFRKNGFSVADDAVELILDMVENNTETLKSECSRFFYCFERGHVITVDDVDKILAHNREENAFTLFEALADESKSPKERLETSLSILQKIRLSRDSGGVAIIAGLTYCFRVLRTYHSLYAGGKTPSDAQLRAAGLGGKKSLARYAKAARIWGPGTTASILSLLSCTDIAIRESGSLMEDTRLVMMVYAIVVKNGLYP
ncbi:MAG: DNA polymerase III subunit delta, partial [Treponema sp.]|nr:DNA polymerase III subunit delta [Treponema sp.]